MKKHTKKFALGYVPIRREILESPLMKDRWSCQLYMYLQCRASIIDRDVQVEVEGKFRKVKCLRGRLIIDVNEILEKLGIEPTKLDSLLKNLTVWKLIRLKKDEGIIKVTIRNYGTEKMTKKIELEEGGWVKENVGYSTLCRDILNSIVICEPYLAQHYLFCLLKANFEPGVARLEIGDIIITEMCNRAELITGSDKGSQALGTSASTFRNKLIELEEIKLIQRKVRKNKYTKVKVLNFGPNEMDGFTEEQLGIRQDNDSKGTRKRRNKTIDNGDIGKIDIDYYKRSLTFYEKEKSKLKDNAKESSGFSDYVKITDFILERLSNLHKLKEQLTYIEYCKLVSKHKHERVQDVLIKMHNHKSIVNKVSIYFTAYYWLGGSKK